MGLSGGIICSNLQQHAHALNYVIWALLSASSTREQLIAARTLHVGFPRFGRRTPEEELVILTWAGLCLASRWSKSEMS